eukprot:366228-Chlamydomonas_euryale.AAC.4
MPPLPRRACLTSRALPSAVLSVIKPALAARPRRDNGSVAARAASVAAGMAAHQGSPAACTALSPWAAICVGLTSRSSASTALAASTSPAAEPPPAASTNQSPLPLKTGDPSGPPPMTPGLLLSLWLLVL